jgi:hypothetical protein
MNALKLIAALFALSTLTISSSAAPGYPIKKSPNNHYLVDQNNIPFLIVGDSPQALIVNLTEAEASAFFVDRAANTVGSFNATATLSTGAWLMQIAAFKPAAPFTPPTLRIFRTGTNTFILVWPTNSTTFILQQSPTLVPTSWTASTNPVVIVGAESQATISPSGSQQYFRLK